MNDFGMAMVWRLVWDCSVDQSSKGEDDSHEYQAPSPRKYG